MLSPAIITLPWRPDAAEHYFAPLSALPWAMLLHSGFADHPHNRFDILVAAPRATLLTRGEQTWVDDGETVVVSAEDPLQLLQQQLDRQPFTPQPHDDLPFLGGALGLFGYDLGRRFERLLRTRRPISRWRIWRWGSMTGRLSSTTSANRYRCSAMTILSGVSSGCWRNQVRR